MAKIANLARMTTATTGTGTITLGSAVSSFLTFAQAGITNGQTITYAIEDGSNREIGRGVYTSSGTTLTRTVLRSTNSNAAINLSGSAQVFITAAAEDIEDRAALVSRTYVAGVDFACVLDSSGSAAANSAAFQAAMAADPGGTFLFPAGDVWLTTDTLIPGFSVQGNYWDEGQQPTIRGANRNTRFRTASTTGHLLRHATFGGTTNRGQNTRLVIEGISFIGPGTFGSAISALGIDNTRQPIVRNCLFRGFPGNGAATGDPGGVGIDLYAFQRGGMYMPVIEDCYFGASIPSTVVTQASETYSNYTLADIATYSVRRAIRLRGPVASTGKITDPTIVRNVFYDCIESLILDDSDSLGGSVSDWTLSNSYGGVANLVARENTAGYQAVVKLEEGKISAVAGSRSFTLRTWSRAITAANALVNCVLWIIDPATGKAHFRWIETFNAATAEITIGAAFPFTVAVGTDYHVMYGDAALRARWAAGDWSHAIYLNSTYEHFLEFGRIEEHKGGLIVTGPNANFDADLGMPRDVVASNRANRRARVVGKATAATSTTLTLPVSFQYVPDNRLTEVFVSSGTGHGQVRTVTAWDRASRVATVSPAFSITPDTTSEIEGRIDQDFWTGQSLFCARPRGPEVAPVHAITQSMALADPANISLGAPILRWAYNKVGAVVERGHVIKLSSNLLNAQPSDTTQQLHFVVDSKVWDTTAQNELLSYSVGGVSDVMVVGAVALGDWLVPQAGQTCVPVADGSATRDQLSRAVGRALATKGSGTALVRAFLTRAAGGVAPTVAATGITDSTTAGRALLTAADTAAQHTALSLVPGTDIPSFADGAETDIASGITWDGTAPSGTSSLRMRWHRVGRIVFVEVRLEYATAGATNTTVTIDLPGTLPAPSDFSGHDSGEHLFAALAELFASPTGNSATTRAWVGKTGSTYQFKAVFASTSARLLVANFSYKAA